MVRLLISSFLQTSGGQFGFKSALNCELKMLILGEFNEKSMLMNAGSFRQIHHSNQQTIGLRSGNIATHINIITISIESHGSFSIKINKQTHHFMLLLIFNVMKCTWRENDRCHDITYSKLISVITAVMTYSLHLSGLNNKFSGIYWFFDDFYADRVEL